ncbi:MAG TPA: homoserine kinase [Chloroflexota bacterium]
MRVTARVPATAANLGSGFDCLGIALELRSEVVLDLDRPFGIEIEGEGEDRLPRDGRNLVARTIRGFFERLGRPVPPFHLTLRNRIPQTGGLGSSSAALVGALLAANVVAGRPSSVEQLLCLAAELEGHPDNVAPAVLGGLVVAVVEPDAGLLAVPLSVPPELSAVVFVPGFVMRTRRARQVLPKLVPHRDAVFNASRTALLVSAFQSGRLDLLRVAMQDRLHQPYRSQLFPAMGAVFEAALGAGACGACLSGAGSAILAFATDRQSAIGEAMQRAAHARGVEGRWLTADIARSGADVIVAD